MINMETFGNINMLARFHFLSLSSALNLLALLSICSIPSTELCTHSCMSSHLILTATVRGGCY